MTFNSFAERLYAIIGNGNTTAKFALELFCNIIEYPEALEDENPLDEQLLSTFKSYYNGTRSIRGLAKKVNPYIETTKFESYIESFTDGAQVNICSSFQEQCPGMTTFTVGREMAELFQRILIEAVTTKKATTSVSAGDGLKEKYGVGLVIESNCICPNDHCSHSLQSDSNGQTILLYDVFQIDASLPATSDNLLAMCPSCCTKLRQSISKEEIARLKQIKSKLMKGVTESAILSSEAVERGVERVLEKIRITPDEDLVPLNYQPVAVRQKIKTAYNPLYIRVKAYVTAYYNMVDQWLKQIDQEGKQRFRPFCNSVKINYLKLLNDDLTQPAIFDKLVDWIQNNTNEDRMACEIVISYFVQKCEVFDAITE